MRTVFYCRSFEKELQELEDFEKNLAESRINAWAHGNLGGRLLIKKYSRAVYRKKVTDGCRIIAEVKRKEIYLLFVGSHDEYDIYRLGKRQLPSITGSNWREWEIAEDTEIRFPNEEEAQLNIQKDVHSQKLNTKSILDNIVEISESQQAILQLNATGPILIRGVAGSGKTSLGLHRAQHISKLRTQSGKDTSILILTYSKALKTALNWSYAESFSELPPDLIIDSYGDWMVELLQESGLNYTVHQSPKESIRSAREEVASSHPQGKILSSLSSSFLLEEINEVIRAREISSLEEYIHVKRTGRRRGLNQSRRKLVWLIYKSISKHFVSRTNLIGQNCPNSSRNTVNLFHNLT